MTVTGKVALIAGGAGGIGFAVCQKLAQNGTLAICADVSPERGQQVVESISSVGGKAKFIHLDARSDKSWDAAVTQTMRECGTLDILVTAIYMGSSGAIDTMSPAEWDDCLQIASTAVFLGMSAASKVMKPGSAIINISSVMAHGGAPFNIAYSSAKAAVIAMSRAAATRLADRGIRVNVVSPGLIQTRAMELSLAALASGERSTDSIRSAYLRRIPMKRIGDPMEIANAVEFLASPLASYITGAELVVDGGLLAS